MASLHDEAVAMKKENRAIRAKGQMKRISKRFETGTRQGFALTELLIVMLMLAIMVAVAVPNLRQWFPNMRLKGAARNLYSNLQKAKVEAVKRNSCVGIAFSTVTYPAEGGSYVVFVDDGSGIGGIACNRTQDGSEQTLFSVNMPEDVSLVSASIGSSNSFCFNSRAVTCGSQSGNIQLRNNQSRWYKISVTSAGGLRLEVSGDGSNWTN